MSTLRVNNLQDLPGTGQPSMSGAAKAWVNFDGTGAVAIRAAFNVSSITDNGVGDYTVNFTNPMLDGNYAVCTTGQRAGDTGAGFWSIRDAAGAMSASGVRLSAKGDGVTVLDPPYMCVAIFR